MAGSAGQVDDSFLDEPDDSFLDDSFLDDAPDTDSLGGKDIAGNWRMDAQTDEQGPPISEAEREQVRQPLALRVRYALAKRQAKQPLTPAENDALKQYLSDKDSGAPAIGPLETANAHGANAAAFDLGDEALGHLRAAGRKLTGDPKAYADLASEEKTAIRDYLRRAEEQNPGTAATSKVLGGLASGIAGPAGKLATLAQGALAGYGASDKSGTDALPDAAGGAVAAHYGGKALEAAGAAGRGALQAGTRLAGHALELPGRGVAALEEWLGGKGIAQRGGDAPIALGDELGDTSGQIALKRAARDTGSPPVQTDAETPMAEAKAMQQTADGTVPAEKPAARPKLRVQHHAQNFDAMDTKEAMSVLAKEDPRIKAGIGYDNAKGAISDKDAADILAHHERSTPVLNKIARENNPNAALTQAAREPTEQEEQSVIAALDRLAARGREPFNAGAGRAQANDDFLRWKAGQDALGRSPKLTPEQAALYSGMTPEEKAAFIVPRGGGDKNPAYRRMTDEQLAMDQIPDEQLTPAQRNERSMLVRRGLEDDGFRTGYDPGDHAPGYDRPTASAPSSEMGPNDLKIWDQIVKNGRDPRTPLPAELQPKGETKVLGARKNAGPRQPIQATEPETRTNYDAGQTGAYPRLVDNDATRTRVKPGVATEQQKTAPWEPKPESVSARARLQKQANGRRLMKRAAPVAGLVGGVTGFAHGGPMGAAAGMMAAATGKGAAGAGIDVATVLGQHLRAVADKSMRPELFAQKLASDPRLATELAKRPGKIGQAGRSIAEAVQQGGANAAKARAWTIANQPWFQEQLQSDEDGQAAPSSAATAP